MLPWSKAGVGQELPRALACMAPRFSISCSGLEDPRRTELTPSFLRHHAGNKVTGWLGTKGSLHCTTADPGNCQNVCLYLTNNNSIFGSCHFPGPLWVIPNPISQDSHASCRCFLFPFFPVLAFVLSGCNSSSHGRRAGDAWPTASAPVTALQTALLPFLGQPHNSASRAIRDYSIQGRSAPGTFSPGPFFLTRAGRGTAPPQPPRHRLPTASWGSVQPRRSAMGKRSFSFVCCFLPSSLMIFSFSHW